MKIQSFKELIVWQKAMDLVVAIYKLTSMFPKTEIYGLTSQMRRAAVSIPSNIAEGRGRGSRQDFRHFLINAFGSASELETQLGISKRLNFYGEQDFLNADGLLDEVMRMLQKMITSLNQPIT